jgi:hypothetical protein
MRTLRGSVHAAAIGCLAVTSLGCRHNVSEIKPAEATDGAPTDTRTSDARRDGAPSDAAPSSVTVSGKVRLYSSTDPASFQAGVKVHITNLTPALSSMASGADGSYTIAGIPPAAAVDIELDLTQQVPAVDASANVLPSISSRFSLQLTKQATQQLDLPMVTYAWMAQVAYQCGAFSTLAAAEMSMGATNPYFIKRSTVFGTLVGSNGSPMAGVPRSAISVNLDGWENKDPNPNDTDAQPTKVCFLDEGPSATYIGTTDTMSNATGRFVVFRVRDPDEPDAGTFGLGNGLARVQVSGFVSQTVNLPASGNIGMVTLNAGQDPTPSFATEVVPIFRALGCSSCHTPGTADAGQSVGYVNSQQHLDLSLSKTSDEIYQELIADSEVDGGTSCATMKPTPILCLSSPAMSLLLENLLGMNMHPETFITDTTDPSYQTILSWITAGAPNN